MCNNDHKNWYSFAELLWIPPYICYLHTSTRGQKIIPGKERDDLKSCLLQQKSVSRVKKRGIRLLFLLQNREEKEKGMHHSQILGRKRQKWFLNLQWKRRGKFQLKILIGGKQIIVYHFPFHHWKGVFFLLVVLQQH